MTEIEFLNWVRGTGFQIATVICVGGIIIRILEILLLGRKANLAEGKGCAVSGGVRTVFTRFVPEAGTLKRSTFTIISGYIFHIGLFVTIFFFAPHVMIFKDVLGFSWASLPTPLVDILTVITIITLLMVLAYRLNHKVLAYLTNFEDILVWFVTIAPLVTGYMAFHRLGMSAPTLLGIHILSVELLMVVFPFTKLMHTFTLFMARWYNGATSAYRGVKS